MQAGAGVTPAHDTNGLQMTGAEQLAGMADDVHCVKLSFIWLSAAGIWRLAFHQCSCDVACLVTLVT